MAYDPDLAASAYRDGGLMIRCSAHDWKTWSAEDGARPMLRKGEPVSGWVLIAADVVNDDESLGRWIRRGLDFVASQPPKPEAGQSDRDQDPT